MQALDLAEHNVLSYSNANEALQKVSRDFSGVIVTDIKMPGIDGLEFMNMILDIDPEIPIILMTGHGDIPMAINAIRGGAFEFIEKPFPSDKLVEVVEKALEKRKHVIALREESTTSSDTHSLENVIIGNTPQIRQLRESILQFGKTDADVLIFGETGTGKELVARSLHQNSPRKDGKFFAINCGGLSDTVIESELFGHETGAFTGASKQRIGKIEHANGGTLFLDEIESMPMDLQIKLLRVIQERVIERLGANEIIPVDIRVIAATKKDLKVHSDEGHFREDLYYRLNILNIEIPALRNRIEDIPILFKHFVYQAALRYKCVAPEIHSDHLVKLMQYEWPGNVRELQNTALRFSLGLGVDFKNNISIVPSEISQNGSLQNRISEVEKRLIEQELSRNSGNLKATYEALGISRKTLYDKMRKFNLHKPDYGSSEQ